MNKVIPEPLEMFKTASVFDLTSQLISAERSKRQKTGDYSIFRIAIAAIVANHAFAIEMYFKCIAIIEKGDFLWGHKLLEQYNFLDQSTRNKIKTLFDNFVQHNKTLKRWESEDRKPPNMDLIMVLEQANKAFEEHRYTPIGKQQSYYAADLSKALRKYILEIKPEYA